MGTERDINVSLLCPSTKLQQLGRSEQCHNSADIVQKVSCGQNMPWASLGKRGQKGTFLCPFYVPPRNSSSLAETSIATIVFVYVQIGSCGRNMPWATIRKWGQKRT